MWNPVASLISYSNFFEPWNQKAKLESKPSIYDFLKYFVVQSIFRRKFLRFYLQANPTYPQRACRSSMQSWPVDPYQKPHFTSMPAHAGRWSSAGEWPLRAVVSVFKQVADCRVLMLLLKIPMLRLLSSKAQECKDFWITSILSHVGIHWRALTE